MVRWVTGGGEGAGGWSVCSEGSCGSTREVWADRRWFSTAGGPSAPPRMCKGLSGDEFHKTENENRAL